MRYEACDVSPHFYRVRGVSKITREFLQYSVKAKFRYFEEGSWYVHRSQVLPLTQLGYGETGHVDYSALDDSLQMRIAQEKRNWKTGGPKSRERVNLSKKISKESALRTLHLQPDAPDSLIKATWRHLASIHHPDKGGDAEQFKTYLEAYNIVKK